ncbi:hypothetical protein [Actinoplanes sp. DH11]|uniref:hypothetical protein n=1 Tax=Actinoplanes sp. DH11 TaxID=2857011 RepID=UPI001E4F8FC1|nr:hypothetical protein [Actinoplanes sp. DH11]
MANEEQNQPTQDLSTGRRPSKRRKQALIAVAGAAVAVSGAAFFATQSGQEEQASLAEPLAGATTTAPAPAEPSASASAEASPSAGAGASTQATEPTKDATVKAATPSPAKHVTTQERIERAREAAAKDGVKIQSARKPDPATKPATDIKVVKAKAKGTGIMRVVTAKGDLTGQRELLWAADKGKKVGEAKCTQNFKFSNESSSQERPTLLLCWRTSADRSVVTVAVSEEGSKPSAAKSVAEIERQWVSMR